MIGWRLDDRYILNECIGAGGFGQVFLARDTKMDRDVAIKVVKDEGEPAHLARLLREAKVLAGIRHPNIVYILDVGDSYIVMERLTGPDLLKFVKPRLPLPVDEAASYGVALAGALTVLHDRADPIVHRDIKLDNIMLDGERGRQQVKLVDFGLAAAPNLTRVTQIGVVVGTPGYMAPERRKGLLSGPPSDVYALGVTLHVLLSGSMPVAADPSSGRAARSLAQLRPALPPGLADLVDRMLAADPAVRPGAAEVRGALASVGGARAAAEAVASRLAGQFTEIQVQFGQGREAFAAFALVRLLARAGAELGSDHSLVRRIKAYAELRRTP